MCKTSMARNILCSINNEDQRAISEQGVDEESMRMRPEDQAPAPTFGRGSIKETEGTHQVAIKPGGQSARNLKEGVITKL